MAEGKGYRVIVEINLPPEEQFHRGHSLIVQGDTVDEVAVQLDQVTGFEGNGKVVLAAFGEFALQGGVVAALSKNVEAGDSTEAAVDSAAPAPAPTPTGEMASDALLKAVAKKLSKTVDELGPLTKAQALELKKGGNQ